MRNAELYIKELKQLFVDKDYIKVEELHTFYQSFNTNISKSTINWRMRTLVQTGIMQRIGRGKYKLGLGKIFQPLLTNKIFKVNSAMKQSFPYLKYIIWHTSDINSFSQHLVNKDICYVEVERDAVDAVFEVLREKYKYVLRRQYEDDVYFGESIIIVRVLVSGSPVQMIRNVPTITIEKLLVDLFSDNDFNYLRGNELTHVYSNAFSMYTINTDKLLRYASRKEKRTVITNFINTIN
jgi:hypothetical protein